jgi:hypothetical protein
VSIELTEETLRALMAEVTMTQAQGGDLCPLSGTEFVARFPALARALAALAEGYAAQHRSGAEPRLRTDEGLEERDRPIQVVDDLEPSDQHEQERAQRGNRDEGDCDPPPRKSAAWRFSSAS